MFHKKITDLRKNIKERRLFFFVILLAVIIGVSIVGIHSSYSSNSSIFNDARDIYNSIFNRYKVGNTNSNSQNATDNYSSITKNNKKIVPNRPSISYENAVINAVKKTTPAVVSIVITKNLPVIEQCPYNPFSNMPEEFRQFFGNGTQFYTQCKKGMKRREIGGGSGFIISSDGLIVTNKHVVSDKGAQYSVLTNNGKTYKATVLARDPFLDLAIIKINASNLPTVILGNSDNIKLGETAITIGNALGKFSNTVSRGVISGLSRDIVASSPESANNKETINNVIQTDAAINPGNSGGPLINIYGEVIGINVAMVSGAQNIGFSIPINEAKRAIRSVEKTGKIEIAFLGVRYEILNSEIAKSFGIKINHGALLIGGGKNFAVELNSPAYVAGLKEGDVIISVDGVEITKNNSLAGIISTKNPGDEVVLKVWRDGKTINIRVKLGKRDSK